MIHIQGVPQDLGRGPCPWILVCESWDAVVSIASAVIHEDLFAHLSWHASPVMSSDSTRTNLCRSTKDPGLSNLLFAENAWTDTLWIQYWNKRIHALKDTCVDAWKAKHLFFKFAIQLMSLLCYAKDIRIAERHMTVIDVSVDIDFDSPLWGNGILCRDWFRSHLPSKNLKGLYNYMFSDFQIVLGGIEIDIGFERCTHWDCKSLCLDCRFPICSQFANINLQRFYKPL